MLGILLSYYFKNEHTLKKSTRVTTSENLLQGWSSNRRRERFIFLALSLSMWYNLSPYQLLLLLVYMNFISLFPLLFFVQLAHLHNSWVSIMVFAHARTQKHNLNETRNEQRSCRTISFYMYGASRLLYVCAFNRTFYMLLNKNKTIAIL